MTRVRSDRFRLGGALRAMLSAERSESQRGAKAVLGAVAWPVRLALTTALAAVGLVAAGCMAEPGELAVIARPFQEAGTG